MLCRQDEDRLAARHRALRRGCNGRATGTRARGGTGCVALVGPRRPIRDHGIEQRDAEPFGVGARRRAHVDPELVHADDGGVTAVLLREVPVEDGAHAEHSTFAAVRGEDAHALRFERLVPERKRRRGARAMQPHIAVVGDLADGVR